MTTDDKPTLRDHAAYALLELKRQDRTLPEILRMPPEPDKFHNAVRALAEFALEMINAAWVKIEAEGRGA